MIGYIEDGQALSFAGSRAVHTTMLDGGLWTNGNGTTYRTLAEAMTAGRQLARLQRVEHVIHGRDGTVRERNSYDFDWVPENVASAAR